MPKTVLDYRAGKPIWCSYCGNYNLLTSLYMALASLNVEPKDLVVVSGIGCSSRMPGFVRNYGFHSIHGRGLPIATGVKEANPSLTVLAVMGDGDGLGIGGGHMLHALRRNADITCILVDNGLYGMTKGQPSPTTPYGVTTSTTPYGNPDEPVNPVALALGLGAGFVARAYTGNLEQTQALLADAVRYKGTSLVHVIAPCPTFNTRETYKYYIRKVSDVPMEHDPTDLTSAMALAMHAEKLYTGLFRNVSRPSYEELLAGAREKTGHSAMVELIERFR